MLRVARGLMLSRPAASGLIVGGGGPGALKFNGNRQFLLDFEWVKPLWCLLAVNGSGHAAF